LLTRDNAFLGEIDLSEFDLADEVDRRHLLDEIVSIASERHDPAASSVIRTHFYGCSEVHAVDAQCDGPVASLDRNRPPFH
jgi:hypothetical protein